MEAYGLWGLFFGTFLSSTILPFPSEALVVACIALGYDHFLVLMIASFGNILGSLSTYILGYLGLTKILERMGAIDHKRVQYFRKKSHQYGALLAFFAFLPIFGDVFVLALGLSRYSILKTVIFLTLGKVLRYMIVIFGTEWFVRLFELLK